MNKKHLLIVSLIGLAFTLNAAPGDRGIRDRAENVRDRREDVRDRREDVRDRREDRRDRIENKIDN